MKGALAIAAFAACLGACGACSDKKTEALPASTAPASPSASAAAVAEVLPRCRADAARAVIEGEDVVVGDVALSSAGLLVGVARRKGGARVGAVLRANADLGGVRIVDVAPLFGDDPPPSPRWRDGVPYVGFLVRKEIDSGTTRGMRELRFAKVGDDAIGAVEATVTQQSDESTAFDVAWPLVAWDEDALVLEGKFLPDRGVVKVQSLPDGKPRVVSPDSSDAEAPKLAERKGGGWWVAWLARRPEVEDAGWRLEGAGDLRAYRWVEILAIDAKGEPASPVRRISSERGHAVAFEIVSSDPELVVVVQDEGAPSEGAGSRLVRHTIESDRVASSDVIDAGIGHGLADIVPGWVTWKDVSDRAWIAPAAADGGFAGRATAESALDGARILAASPPDVLGNTLYVTTAGNELRRFRCAPP